MKSYFESKVDSVKKWPRMVRITVGILLILGGILGFLPILGFWMIPLGLILLAVDFRWARHALVNLRWRLRAMQRRLFARKNGGRSSRGAGNGKRAAQSPSSRD